MKKPWKSNINAEKGYDSPLQLGDLESIRRGDKRLECAENFIPEYDDVTYNGSTINDYIDRLKQLQAILDK